jgi:hypothetical protein
MNIFHICLENNIHLEIEWIPREMNDQADYLSCIVDYDDFGIVQNLFDDISNELGPYDIDLFACGYNAKVEKSIPDFGILFPLQYSRSFCFELERMECMDISTDLFDS